MPDPLMMLREDHQKVKQLFSEFESTQDTTGKWRIAHQAIEELEIHAAIEEQIFYPAFARSMQDMGETVMEAEEEHHVVHVLTEELREMDANDPHFDAKFKVLAENVKHHIQEEESELLPKAQQMDRSQLEQIGQQMMELKQAMKQEMGRQA
jgi:hemerythrin-like domain-containing protein